MHKKRIPQYYKMMKLSRREILKELFPKLMSKLVLKCALLRNSLFLTHLANLF